MWNSWLSFDGKWKYPHRAPFTELHYMSNDVPPWNAVQELAAPALQSLLVRFVVLLYLKMHETKWKKIGMIPFYLDLNISFLHFSCLLFYLKVEPGVQNFSNGFCKCCSVVAWPCLLVAWGDPLPLVGILLNSEGAFACPAVQKSTTSFLIVFLVHEVSFINSTLEDKLPGGEKCSLMIQRFPFCLGWWGYKIPFWGSVLIPGWGIPHSHSSGTPDLLYASLPTDVTL